MQKTTRHWKQLFTKLRDMDRQELFSRSRQELSKRCDTLLAKSRYDFSKNSRSSAQVQSGEFFFRPDQVENLLHLIGERLPEQAGKIVERAERICAHHFDLLGYENLDYGSQINWHLDVVHRKTAPRKAFYRVQYLNFDEVGDSKVTWELNRHQHLVTLAKAYRLTGDERFAREIVSQWRSWNSENPYLIGINWASSLEVSFRAVSWIWTHALLKGTRFLTDEFEAEYLSAQALNGRHIARYLSTYFSPNTHLLGEGMALFFLGTMCPELANAETWKPLGWQIVLAQAEVQVNPDGMHFEQSLYYHLYALDFFVHAALLASANGVVLPTTFEQKLERMMNVLFLLSRSGPPARFGDDDGGRLFDPARNRDQHLIDPLATGAVLFQRADYKSLCRELREETIWLTGEQGVAEWDRLESSPLPLQSAPLVSSGIYVLAASPAKAQLVFKGGASITQTRNHAHADAMSLILQSCGHSLLIDPGACEYVGEGGRRNLYRGTAMHNTLTVDGQDQAEPLGPFSWRQEIGAVTERWVSGETFDWIVGSHRGYSRLSRPVQHRRFVVALKTGLFFVRDSIEGEGRHHLEISWRLSPDLQLLPNDVFRLNGSSQGLALLTVRNHGWSEEVHKGPWSPAYGLQRTTTVLKFDTTCRVPAEFASVLVPLTQTAQTPGKLTCVSPQNAKIHAYRYQENQIDHQFFFSKSGERWSYGPVASDAEFVCLTQLPGQSMDVIFCGGTYIELDGSRLLTASRVVDRCEIVNRETVQVFCSEPQAIAKWPSSSKRTLE
jgi:Heparinase II/III N-terminus/Heparinase II/III-like protein